MSGLISAPGTGSRHRARARGAGALRGASARARSRFEGAGGEPTLDDVLSGAWEALAAHAVVECPVCRAEMEPRYGAGALALGGRCSGCGTSLG